MIIPGDIDSEITETFKSNERANIETSRPLEDDIQSSTSISTVNSNSSIRIARLDKVPEVMKNDIAKRILDKMSRMAEHKTNMDKDLMKQDLNQIKYIFKGIDRCYDIAFVAGILTEEGTTTPMRESVNHALGISPETRGAKLGRATQCLPKTTHKISIFLNTVCDPNNLVKDTSIAMETWRGTPQSSMHGSAMIPA